MSYYMHEVPGRLRVRTPKVKNNKDAAQKVENLLLTMAGVGNVAFNLTTGSCLVSYDPTKARGDDILSLLTEKGYFDPSKAVTNDQCFHNAASTVLSLLVALI
jgi:hypothetical protein